MQKSLSHGAGYLLIDHTDSPGLAPADVAQLPVPHAMDFAVGSGQVLERDVKQCRHCQRTVVLHPDRVRPRAYCPLCDAYICDPCDAIRATSLDHTPFEKVLDLAQNHAEKFLGRPDHPDASPDILLTDRFKE